MVSNGKETSMSETLKEKAKRKHRRVLLQGVKIGVDVSEPIMEIQEAGRLVKSLKRFLDLIFDNLSGELIAKCDQLRVRHLVPAFRARHNICRFRASRKLKLVSLALRALRIRDAHRVLVGRAAPKRIVQRRVVRTTEQ